MTIYNLTQHSLTIGQLEAGIVDLPASLKEGIMPLLNIDAGEGVTSQCIEQARDISRRLGESFGSCNGLQVMLGGHPLLVQHLDAGLNEDGINCYFAVTDRVSEDSVQEDGSIQKVSVFKHIGLVETYTTEVRTTDERLRKKYYPQ